MLMLGWGQSALAQSKGETFTYESRKYQVTGDNLITNPSFENDFAGWTGANDFTTTLSAEKFEILSDGAQDGSKYLHPKASEGATANGSIGTGWNIEKGKTYVFSYYYKVSQVNSAGSNTEFQYWKTSLTNTLGTETSVLGWPVPSEANQWIQYQIVFTNTEYEYLQVIFRWLTGTPSFDNFVLAEVTEMPNTDGLQAEITQAKTLLETLDASSKTYATLNEAIAEAEGKLQSSNADEVAAAQETLSNVCHYAELKMYDATASAPVATDLVVNPGFDEGTTGWTNQMNVTGYNQGIASNQSGDITDKFYEIWKWESYEGQISQTLNNLPNGTYLLKAAAFRDQLTAAAHDNAVYVFANDNKTLVTAVNGHYYYVAANVTDGTLTFGVKSEKAVYRWMGIDNVSLTYYGTEDVAETIATDYAKAEWEAAKTTGENVLADEKYSVAKGLLSVLSNAVQATPSTLAEYETARGNVVVTSGNLDIALPSYQQLASEVSNAKIFMDVTEYEELLNSETTTLAEIDAAPETLYADEYARMILLDNKTDLIGNIADWGGDMIMNKGQHWSGNGEAQYAEQTGEQWGAGNWNVYKETSVTLPAGKYVLTATGRASAQATLTMSVAGKTVTFPQKGNTGYGVETDGTANLTANGTYANNGAGHGWEYRYCAFELDAEQEVTIRIKGSAVEKQQWVSISDVALYSVETEVSLNITEAGWATLILPFEAEVPENVTAYTCGAVGEVQDGVATLTLAESDKLEANTPYILQGAVGTYSFKGQSVATEDSYTVGLLTGTLVDMLAKEGTYVLQNQDSGVGFYKVGSDSQSTQPEIGAYRAYLNADAVAGGNVQAFILKSIDGDGTTTGIDGTVAEEDATVNVYNLNGILVRQNVKMGEALDGLQKGVYIVNGTKKAVK